MYIVSASTSGPFDIYGGPITRILLKYFEKVEASVPRCNLRIFLS